MPNPIIVVMNQSGDITEARKFADNAYAVEVSRISKASQENLQRVQAQFAAQGAIRSGGMTMETARIHGERITALIQSRLNLLLEGYELHSVQLDDQLITNIIDELSTIRTSMISQSLNAVANGVIDLGRNAGASPSDGARQPRSPSEISRHRSRKHLRPRRACLCASESLQAERLFGACFIKWFFEGGGFSDAVSSRGNGGL
jgi:hypothetical protein